MACLIRPPKRTSITKAAPRRSTTVPVMPWNRWWGHPFWTLESMTIVTRSPTSNDWNDRVIGESPRSRGLRRNFCRVFSMIPFEALTISSLAVVDVQHVELEDLARHAEPFREGRPRPASVPVDPFFDVGPCLRRHANLRSVAFDTDDLRRQQPSSPCGIRAPVNDPPRRALGDRLGDQNQEGSFKLCFRHDGGGPHHDPIGLRGAVLLQRDDGSAVAWHEPVDLDNPRGIDPLDGCNRVEAAPPGLFDLEDERPSASEHPRVDVFAAHPVQRVAGPSRFAHDLRGDDLLHARRVHLPRAAAPDAPLPHATPARPAGLRHAAGQLAVAAAEVERIHLEVHVIEDGIEDADDVRASDVRFLPNPFGDPLSDFPVHLGFQRFRAREPELRPEGFLPRGDLGIDLRSDPKRVELPRLELARDEVREAVVPGREPIADPAWTDPDLRDIPDRAAPFLVRVSMANFPEQSAQARIAQRPLGELRPVDGGGCGDDLVHGSLRSGGGKNSCEQEDADQEGHQDDPGHQDGCSGSGFREREEAQQDADQRRREQDEDPEAEKSRRCELDELRNEGPRRHGVVGERGTLGADEDEPEQEDGNGHEDAASQDVIDQAVRVLDLADDRATERRDAVLDEPDARAGRDHTTPENPRARTAIAIPSAARKIAKTNRTLAAFARTRSRVPKFVPVKTPMMTIAARLGSTRPCE